MEQLERPGDRGETLGAAARALARGGDLDAALDTLLQDAAGAIGADQAALFTWNAGGDVLQLTAAHGLPAQGRAALQAEVAADPDHPIATAAGAGHASPVRSRILPDGSPATGFDLPLVVAHEGIDRGLGVISFSWSGERTIDDRAVATIQAAADLAALAIDRVHLAALARERAEWMARISTADALTGLANRRTMDRVLELEIERAKRQGTAISVLVFDIDGFRALNANAGSGAGDAVLRDVAAILAEQVRLVDTVARIRR